MRVTPQVLMKVHNRSTVDQDILHSSDTWKKLNTVGQYISYWQIISQAHDSVGREVLYSVVTEFCIPMELGRLIGVS